MQSSQIPCAECGELFTPNTATHIYHSITCKERAKRHRRSGYNNGKSPSVLKKVGPYWAVLNHPTPDDLQAVVSAYKNAPDTHQGIYILGGKPPGFTLPPGLRELLDTQDNIYQISR